MRQEAKTTTVLENTERWFMNLPSQAGPFRRDDVEVQPRTSAGVSTTCQTLTFAAPGLSVTARPLLSKSSTLLDQQEPYLQSRIHQHARDRFLRKTSWSPTLASKSS
ncbi:hypothetical protein J6590_042920 [Homalodisca vitripennis]|nr:hypothetical protein J6590_042920 [Homalodisca vitripennis]